MEECNGEGEIEYRLPSLIRFTIYKLRRVELLNSYARVIIMNSLLKRS
jgi:hypothetical protein